MILNFKSLPLDKQDFTHSSLNLHWAFTLDNKNGGEIKLSLQLKITTPESDKRKLVFKALATSHDSVTSISSIYKFPQTYLLNSTFSSFLFQSLKNQLSNKA